jgi:1-acyl-sn-glycerol-3-phosphate acyltransferase
VLGIAVILLISFLFQPFLFGVFVQNRIDKKRTPIPFFQFILSNSCFIYFITGCTIFHPAMIVSYFLPLPKKLKRRGINIFISKFAKSVVYAGIHVRKRIFGRENLNLEKPAIIIANHSSFLDIILMLMLNPRIIIMVKEWVYKSPFFGFAVRYAGYIYADSGNEENLDKIKQRIADGYSIMIFPEGSRSDDGSIQRFYKGAFYLADKLNLDIIPILIHGANEVSPKLEMMVKKGEMNLKILPRIKSDDASWGRDYSERTKSILHYFRKEHATFKEERENASYLFTRVFYNYVFKGPIMEWYIRIKYRLEATNYDFYNKLIGSRLNILDIGCGYGYMSFFLHYKGPERKIVAADYDEEKINIAANAYDKTENLEFIHADASEFQFGKQDVIFLNDVLHYLPEQKQNTLLQKCANNLNENGILFIRDGITDLKDRHGMTKTTEFLSTRFFSFNKKENDLHFFSSAFIRQFAQQNNLKVEMQEHSGKTSNVLFILRKGNEN